MKGKKTPVFLFFSFFALIFTETCKHGFGGIRMTVSTVSIDLAFLCPEA
jgi:hypothetical protein